MLEIIKEVLISSKKEKLRRKEEINKRIEELRKEEHELNLELIDKNIYELETKLKLLSSNLIKKILNSRKIKEVNKKYNDLLKIKNDKLNTINQERDNLLNELHELIHNEVLIECEIENIRRATTLEELELTKKQAKDILTNYTQQSEKNVIKAVFLDIKNNQNISTREDIYKNMQKLYQTNVSQFVLAMKKILPIDLISELIDIGIVIDVDKVEFLKELANYTLSPTHNLLPIVQKLESKDRLDNYYYNEVEKVLANMERYSNYPSTALSQLMTLSVLVSMAKTNKNEKQLQK